MKLVFVWITLGLLSMAEGALAKEQTQTQTINLSPSELDWIGQRIYQNEAHQNPQYLTHWNKGEAFPSFGIGHFIWYPAQVRQNFVETFPKLVKFVSKTAPPPVWLQNLSPFVAPWQNRTQFNQAWAKPKLTALRGWLAHTQRQQVEFIYDEFLLRWKKAVASLSQTQRMALKSKLHALTQFKEGRYAVLDYFNFKGIGHNFKEQYHNDGWGLIEVLEGLPSEKVFVIQSKTLKLKEFVLSAKKILQRRIQNAPPTRHEQRWQKGWFNRLQGYLK